ncbi:MAG: hypothetical protein OXC46_00890 [Thaumarchaeota archaeon]|nr:hypothetical protein [Nitrososphaerota archaeon]
MTEIFADYKPCPRCNDKPDSTTKITKADGTVLYCIHCETDAEWEERKKVILKARKESKALQRILRERAGLTESEYQNRMKQTLHPHMEDNKL